MEKIVGMNGNSCGPIRSNSIGLELSSVRGIWVSLQSYSIVHYSTVQSISMYCSQFNSFTSKQAKRRWGSGRDDVVSYCPVFASIYLHPFKFSLIHSFIVNTSQNQIQIQ